MLFNPIRPRHPEARGRLLHSHVAQVILQDLAGMGFSPGFSTATPDERAACRGDAVHVSRVLAEDAAQLRSFEG
jgi:hypothetical protein